jgi:hypothetical protein
MGDQELSDYLVLSRGQWDGNTSPEAVQQAIDTFYPWIEKNIAEGKMRGGSRLKREGATVSRASVVLDGPFGETKEVIGGYWIIRAASLEDAAALAAQNPCMQFGLFYEIRPLDAEPAQASRPANETPAEWSS